MTPLEEIAELERRLPEAEKRLAEKHELEAALRHPDRRAGT
jgi:hypothetical protein